MLIKLFFSSQQDNICWDILFYDKDLMLNFRPLFLSHTRTFYIYFYKLSVAFYILIAFSWYCFLLGVLSCESVKTLIKSSNFTFIMLLESVQKIIEYINYLKIERIFFYKF